MAEPKNSGEVLVLVRDLMMGSRVSTAAGRAGVKIVTVRDPAKLADQAGRLLLVDLNLPGAIEAASAWAAAYDRPVVGFVSHVDTSAIGTARAAGITRILARSAFVEQVEQLLSTES